MSTAAELHPGRRERKKLQTRHQLQRAALRLAAERGLEHVTVEEIADAVDVSRRTFFNYFSSKEEALIGRDPERAERARRSFAERPVEEPPLESLRVVLGQLAGETAEDREQWLARRALIASEPRLLAASLAAWVELERALVDAVAERTGCDPERDLYPALVVAAAVGAARVAAMRWRSGVEKPLSALVDEAFDVLAEGLPAPGRCGNAASRAGGTAPRRHRAKTQGAGR
jgi:AcrR family transcriptional regulator